MKSVTGKNAKLHLSGIIIQQFGHRKRELTTFESAIYEGALRQAARALVSRGQVRRVLEEFDREMEEKRARAEAARAAKSLKKVEPPVITQAS